MSASTRFHFALKLCSILEGFYYQLESGELSGYNIINEEEFFRTLEKLLDEIDFSDND